MKANEAPEKIYISTNSQDGTYYISNQYKRLVEYTSTDAFIEKACSWLRTHSEADYFEMIPDANYCGAGNLNKKRMIEDFVNYMKGE